MIQRGEDEGLCCQGVRFNKRFDLYIGNQLEARHFGPSRPSAHVYVPILHDQSLPSTVQHAPNKRSHRDYAQVPGMQSASIH